MKSEEDEKVKRWHRDQLRLLGCDEFTADLAASAGVDSHKVEALVKKGCPLSQALEIAA